MPTDRVSSLSERGLRLPFHPARSIVSAAIDYAPYRIERKQLEQNEASYPGRIAARNRSHTCIINKFLVSISSRDLKVIATCISSLSSLYRDTSPKNRRVYLLDAESAMETSEPDACCIFEKYELIDSTSSGRSLPAKHSSCQAIIKKYRTAACCART